MIVIETKYIYISFSLKGVQWLHEIMRDLDSLDDSASPSLGCGTHTNDPLWLLELQASNSLQADSKRMDTKVSMHNPQHFCPLAE